MKGYTAIALDTVPSSRTTELLQAKLCLGTLITLYDDFADRPSQRNPELLETLYQLNFRKCVADEYPNQRFQPVLDFAGVLFAQMGGLLLKLPQYSALNEILHFDLQQFYSANRLGSLLTAHPFLHNRLENRLYAHHNMGMVMVGMMDLMALEKIQLSELGEIREVFLMGQRMGRIFNVLSTFERERADGDTTGELAHCQSEKDLKAKERRLQAELCRLRGKMAKLGVRISAFSVERYLAGLDEVRELHETMKGTI